MFSKEKYVFILELVLNVILGVFGSFIVFILRLLVNIDYLWKIFHYFFSLFPPYSVFTAIRNIGLRLVFFKSESPLDWDCGGFALVYLAISAVLFLIIIWLCEIGGERIAKRGATH